MTSTPSIPLADRVRLLSSSQGVKALSNGPCHPSAFGPGVFFGGMARISMLTVSAAQIAA